MKTAVVGSYRSYRDWCYRHPLERANAIHVRSARDVRGYAISEVVWLHDHRPDPELDAALFVARAAADYSERRPDGRYDVLRRGLERGVISTAEANAILDLMAGSERMPRFVAGQAHTGANEGAAMNILEQDSETVRAGMRAVLERAAKSVGYLSAEPGADKFNGVPAEDEDAPLLSSPA